MYLDTDAHAHFTWSVPNRYDTEGTPGTSWYAWDEIKAEYDPDFINPPTWPITLNACGSTSKFAIVRYTFTIESVGAIPIPTVTTFESSKCEVQTTVPQLGLYKVSLTLHTKIGVLDGVSKTYRDNLDVEDWLIASIGDSFASGEGNPDTPGDYVLTPSLTDPLSVTELQSTKWKDVRCHRSAKSAHALLAEKLENRDPHSSVTFISFACSGADLENLFATQYHGEVPQPPSHPLELDPQIEALERVMNFEKAS